MSEFIWAFLEGMQRVPKYVDIDLQLNENEEDDHDGRDLTVISSGGPTQSGVSIGIFSANDESTGISSCDTSPRREESWDDDIDDDIK